MPCGLWLTLSWKNRRRQVEMDDSEKEAATGNPPSLVEGYLLVLTR